MKKFLLLLVILVLLPTVLAADNTTNATTSDCHDLDGGDKDYMTIPSFNIPKLFQSGLDYFDDLFEIRTTNCVGDTNYQIVGIKISVLIAVIGGGLILFFLWRLLRI